MPELTITLPKHHPGQAQVWKSKRRYNVLACGRRWGKTKFITRLLCETALKGYPAGYFAPTYKLLLEVFQECKRRLSAIIEVANLSDKVIRLKTGGQIEFWTLEDEDAGRSRKYKIAAVDEAGMVKNLGEVYHSAIRPTLADLQGDLWMAGTPKGKGFFYQSFAKGQDEAEENWASWQMPTTTNPYILAEEIEEARSGMPERIFRQEFLAEFLDDAGGVFLGVDEVVGSDGQGIAKSIGIDLAKTEDFTVLTAVTAEGKQLEIERFNRMDWDRQRTKMLAFIDRYPQANITMDATGVGDPIVEDISRARRGRKVEGFKFTSGTKTDVINNLAMRIEQKDASLLPDPVQTSELKAYEYTFNPRTRSVSMNAPEGMHDDCVIALGLAIWGLRSAPNPWEIFNQIDNAEPTARTRKSAWDF